MELLLRDTRGADPITIDVPDDDALDVFSRIRCPKCSWRPSESDRWCCYWTGPDIPEPRFDSCGTLWNTFKTRGRCPGCTHRWQWTSCFACLQWSPHEQWYEAGDML